jgi:hypothetical protein
MNTRKIVSIGAMSLAAIFSLLIVAHFIWLGSSSNEWDFKQEKNGIKIWTQKTPGNALLKGRAQFRVKSTLGGIVKIVYDANVHKENNMMKVNSLESVRAPGYYSAFNTFIQAMPFPFETREFVLLSQHLQNPQTKEIELNAVAAPNKIPPSDCCVRLVHLHNRYTLTPLKNGEVDINFFWEIDMGGAFPYVLQNMALPDVLYETMDGFRNLIAKYSNDKFDYISEPNTNMPDVRNTSLSSN